MYLVAFFEIILRYAVLLYKIVDYGRMPYCTVYLYK